MSKTLDWTACSNARSDVYWTVHQNISDNPQARKCRMTLYLIRHGQSQNNAQGDADNRVADPPLTETGHEQARRVAEHLKTAGEYHIARLFCSAMLRTLQTTAPIAEALGLQPEIWLDVHEEGGIWRDDGNGPVGHAGLTRRDIETQFPGFAIPDGVNAAGWWRRPKETIEEARDRALRVARSLRAQSGTADGDVAVVTHGAFANVLVQALISNKSLDGVYFGHYNTGITRIDFVDGMIHPRYLNRVEHLTPDMRT